MSFIWHGLSLDPEKRRKQCYYSYHCLVCWIKIIVMIIKLAPSRNLVSGMALLLVGVAPLGIGLKIGWFVFVDPWPIVDLFDSIGLVTAGLVLTWLGAKKTIKKTSA
jgi:hypothetical protein